MLLLLVSGSNANQLSRFSIMTFESGAYSTSWGLKNNATESTVEDSSFNLVGPSKQSAAQEG
jgi:hypothetical protein